MRKSSKQTALEEEIMSRVAGKPAEVARFLFDSEELQAMHDHANIVSIKRLHFNDHGPVHMRKSALNSIIMANLLHEAGIKLNLEKEKTGNYEDSIISIITASMLHDIGMGVCRQSHENLSVIMAYPLINRMLESFYAGDVYRKVAIKTLILEGIVGHMASQQIHSLEAGLVLIGDGCDMEKGRARITALMANKPQVGDIHKYSASAIQKLRITKGEEKPIRIVATMSQSVGFFQIEEVLFPKIASSPVKPYIELYAGIKDNDMLRYL